MTKKLLIAAAAFVVVALVLVAVLRPIARVAAVTSGTATKAVAGSVTVQAEFIMELKSEVPGRIVKSELDLGAKVTAGTVLAQIDTGDLLLDIEKTQSDYEAAKARIAVGSAIKLDLETAAESLENFERLTKTGQYPQAELEKQRRLVKQIEQKLALENVANKQLIDGYENTLKVQHRQLDKMTITAPFEGIVSAVNARPGDLIGSNATIATLIATSRTVEAKISQEDFADLKLGQKATVRFLGHDSDIYDATVAQILPTAEAETQRYLIHLDVMDGHFVPNISYGADIIKAIRPLTTKPFDVHLMISPTDAYLRNFADAGAQIITVHAESGPHVYRSLQAIRGMGCQAGLALNPGTPITVIEPLLDVIDLVLLMTVNPGFGGQAFLHPVIEKCAAVRELIADHDIMLEVDGGITPETAALIVEAGAHVLVAGSAVFKYGHEDGYRKSIQAIREAAEAAQI